MQQNDRNTKNQNRKECIAAIKKNSGKTANQTIEEKIRRIATEHNGNLVLAGVMQKTGGLSRSQTIAKDNVQTTMMRIKKDNRKEAKNQKGQKKDYALLPDNKKG